MPNRIIKESICTSDNIDQLSLFQEVVFYRLMVNCDDFGRFDARPKLLASRLFPLRDVTPEEMSEALGALCKADLITVYVVNDKPYLQMNTWEKHQQRRSDKSRYPSPEDADCNQTKSDDINCNQMISDDSKCPRNRNRNRESLFDNRESSSLIGDEDAADIIKEHDQVLNAADNAGFQKTDAVRARLIALYADHGLKKMLEGIESCVNHGATNLAYLTAVLNGTPKKKPDKHGFEERDYGNEQESAMERMMAWEGSAV